MKIVFSVATASLGAIYVTIGGKRVPLLSLAGMLKNMRVAKKDADNSYVYFTIGCTIQTIETLASGTYTEVLFTTLEDDGIITVKNFRNQTVTQFEKGTAYLIPYSAGAVVKTTPNSTGMPIEGGSGNYAPTHWCYVATETKAPIKETTITDVWAFDLV